MKSNFKALCLLAVFWLIVFSSSIDVLGINLSYIDECLVVLLLPLGFFRRKLDRKIVNIWFLVVFFTLLELSFASFSKYYRGIYPALLDLFLFLKPILLVLSMIYISRDVKVRFLSYLSTTGTIFIIIATLGYMLNIFIPVFPAFDERFGLKSYSFLLSNPGEFLNVILILSLAIYACSWKSKRYPVICLGIFLAMTTLRVKAFVIIVFSLLIVAYLRHIAKHKNKVTPFCTFQFRKILPMRRFAWVLLLSLIPGWFQFKSYFLTGMTPRLFIFLNSLPLAINYFPFGAGPGTYGSAVAKLFYSPIYTELGFDRFYGLSQEETSFLSDNFWPLVIGQYGFLGLIFCVLMYLKIFKYFVDNINFNSLEFPSFIILSMSLALSTLGSALLIGSIGCLYVILLSTLCVGRS